MALRLAVRATLRASSRPAFARAMSDGPASSVKLTFTSPGKTFFTGADVRQVNVPSTDGEFGILPDHVPVIAALKPGVVSVFDDAGKESKFFVSSGVVTVNGDSSTDIVAEEAVTIDKIDAAEARRSLDAYTSKLNSAGDDLARAEAEIGIEVYGAMVKAVEA